MILGEDFKFRDDMKEDTVPIEMLTGPYKGVILRYTTVAIQEQENGSAKLKFDYELYETGEHTMVGLRKDDRFQIHAGLILNAMILESIEAPDNELRKDDPEEFVEE
jgi:hypothetical protein